MAGVYRRPNSSYWWADFPTPEGGRVRKSTKCRDRGAAARIAREWERAAEHATADRAAGIRRPQALELLTLAGLFLEQVVGLAPRTLATYADNLRLHALPYFGPASDVSTWTAQHIEGYRRSLLNGTAPVNRKIRAVGMSRWAAWRIRRRQQRMKPRRLMSPATANRQVTTVSAMLQWGVETGRLAANVCRGLKPLKERNEARHRALTDLELDALLAQLDDECAAWVRYVVATGLRYTEAQSVRVEDHDFERGFVLVRAGTTKSAQTRRVPLTAQARAAFDAIVARRDLKRGALFVARCRKHPMQAAWKATGLPGRCPSAHDLRHTFASRAIASGLDVEMLRQVLGHTTIATSQRYIHAYGDRWDEMRARLERGGVA